MPVRSLTLWLVLLITASAGLQLGAAPSLPPPLILVSLDGFRWDYAERYPEEAAHLRGLAAAGASARGLIPVFPSNTFPNHYSIATGLYPARHGVINNRYFDPRLGEFFQNSVENSRDGKWWGGEPIWITAVKQGRRSACYFWPGSEATIGGVAASIWNAYEETTPFEARLARVRDWLSEPEDRRPALITFYIEPANSVGHDAGPDSPQLRKTIREVDAQVGALAQAISAVGGNLVVVSDHGMTPTSPERMVALDDYIDNAAVQVDWYGTSIGLRPRDGNIDALMLRLQSLPPFAHAVRAAELPPRYRMAGNPRIPPVWIVLDEGGYAAPRERLARRDERGEHGYDPALETMHGILIVHGPAFRADGARIDRVENVHVYNLLCAATGLVPAPNDGDDRLVRALLRDAKAE